MKHVKLYEQFDLDDLSDEDIFGKKTDPEVGDKIRVGLNDIKLNHQFFFCLF